MKNKLDQLTYEIVDYFKNSEDFDDMYDSYEDAINYVRDDLLTKDGIINLIKDMTFEIECLSMSKKLSDTTNYENFKQMIKIIEMLNNELMALTENKDVKK